MVVLPLQDALPVRVREYRDGARFALRVPARALPVHFVVGLIVADVPVAAVGQQHIAVVRLQIDYVGIGRCRRPLRWDFCRWPSNDGGFRTI